MLPLQYSFGHLSQLGFPPSQLLSNNVERFRFGIGASPFHGGGGSGPPFNAMDLLAYRGFDPRAVRFIQEEPKPQHSYIGLIAMAILSSADKKLVLSDIYQWILDNYPYFRNRGPGWRNSIRHNLSLNDCFIKAGRSANGKGHYWAIHPANVDDFKKGDFRRRRAQRKVRKAMGLQIADDEEDDDDSRCGSAIACNGLSNNSPDLSRIVEAGQMSPGGSSCSPGSQTADQFTAAAASLAIFHHHHSAALQQQLSPIGASRAAGLAMAGGGGNKKRNFDMDSLLAPEDQSDPDKNKLKSYPSPHSLLRSPLSACGLRPPSFPFFGYPPALMMPVGSNSAQSIPATSAAAAAAAAAAMGFYWPPFGSPVPTSTASWMPSPGGGSGTKPLDLTNQLAENAANDETCTNEQSSPNSVAKWQETFAKIMARSYQGRAAIGKHSLDSLISTDSQDAQSEIAETADD